MFQFVLPGTIVLAVNYAVEAGAASGVVLMGILVGIGVSYLFLSGRFHKRENSVVKSQIDAIKAETIEEVTARTELKVRSEIEETLKTEITEKLESKMTKEYEASTALKIKSAEGDAKKILKEAEIEASQLLIQAREEAADEIAKQTEKLDGQKRQLKELEHSLTDRDEQLVLKNEKFEKREQQLTHREKEIAKTGDLLKTKENSVAETLAKISGLSAKEAREELIQRVREDAEVEASRIARKIEEEAIENADKAAKKVIGTAVQRWAGEYVAERCLNVIQIPNDDLKGRIIGREGRNIRAIEAATGVDLIVDDTPNAIMISCFDPIRRETARLTLEKLVGDGRIHPSRIEEVAQKAKKDVEREIKERGERAAFELGIGGLHPDLLNLLGRLRYRTSYGQNQWSHSIEVGFLCGLMAAELGVNVRLAKRAGLLHDIGKALTHEREGSHAVIGAEIAARCGEHEIVRNAIAAHHNDEPQNSVIAHLVIAADALSGARPGARREILETYVQRLRDLEKISSEFNGVEKSFVVQAGREIRVMVENSKVNDDQAFMLSKKIARKIEEEMTYPGQIKVCVIRETRAVDYAK